MSYLERRANRWYAVLTVPVEVRHLVGRSRFIQSTKTANRREAEGRAAFLVDGWKAEIAKARGTLPSPEASFWESLRRDAISAKDAQDEAAEFAVQELIEKAIAKVTDADARSDLWRYATGQTTPIAPFLADWKASLQLVPKTVDQRHRDVSRMAERFPTVEALEPRRIKEWTDDLIREGATKPTVSRIGEGCRSLWTYLRDSGAVAVEAPDPFAGSFRLAVKRARANTETRQAFQADDVAKVYAAATERGDGALADLIALGAYTGARIEELCSLTVKTSADGIFTVEDSKTDAGIRQIPIHPCIRALVTRLQQAAAEGSYLIHSSAAGKYGVRSDPLSKRFGRLKTGLGFGPGHVFHSVRMTVATQLEQAGVPEGIAMDILGHEKPTMTYGRYSSGSSQKDKLSAISKLAYPGTLNIP